MESEVKVNNSSSNKRIAVNSLYMSIRMIFILIIQLYTTRVILSALGVEDYGIYNVVCGFVAMFSFLSTSMMNGIQRFYNYELGKCGEEGIRRVFNVAIRVQGLLALFITVIIEIIGVWYIQNKMVIPFERTTAALFVFQSSILSFIILILQVPYSSVIIAKEKMNIYALLSVLSSVLNLCVAVLIRFSNNDRLILYGFLIAMVQFILFVLYIVCAKHISHSLKFDSSYDKDMMKSMLGFSGWNVFGSLGGVMKEQGVNMLLNLFFGPVVNAARGIANQVNGGFQGLVANLSIAVRPQVTQSYAQGNIERTMNLTYCISKFSCIVLFMFAFPILLNINYVLQLWLGPNVPEYTHIFVIIIVFSSIFSNLNAAVSGVVHSSGKMKTYQISGAIVNLMSLPLAYFALYLGATPVFVMWIMCFVMALGQVVALIVLKTIVDYSIRDYIVKVIVPITIVMTISSILPLILYYLMPAGFLRLIVVSIVSVFMSALVTYKLGCTDSERELLKSLLRKFVDSLKNYSTKS